MTPTMLCQYCSHRTDASADRCSYCGAPLGADVPADTALSAGTPNSATEVGALPNSWFPEQKSIAWLEPIRRRRFFPWVLGGVAVAVVVLLVLLVMNIIGGVRHIHFNIDTDIGGMPGFGGGGSSSAAQSLPVQLRDSSNCQDSGGGGYTCMLNPESPLIMGDGVDGRGLMFRVGVVPRGSIAATVNQWRNSTQEVVRNGPAFAAIGSSNDVRYLNPATGLRLQTDALPSRQDAESFLSRSGLVETSGN